MIIVIVMSRLSVRFPSGTLGTDSSIQTERNTVVCTKNGLLRPSGSKDELYKLEKLWLVGVATDRDAPLACLNVKNLSKK